jgi:hypothetical protein
LRTVYSILVVEKDIEIIHIEFNNEAKKIFFLLYKKFANAVKAIDRRKDDNVFQLLKGKYTYTLKQQLEEFAKGLITKYKATANLNQLERSLTNEINTYTNEFDRKTGSL